MTKPAFGGIVAPKILPFTNRFVTITALDSFVAPPAVLSAAARKLTREAGNIPIGIIRF